MSKPKLTYFDIAASRGEECRLALFVGGVDFDDHRLRQGEWAALKQNTPYGALPTLEVEGKPTLAQSNAILSYVGRAHGLHPKDPWEAACHEALMQSVEELRNAMSPLRAIKDEAEKKSSREQFAAGYLTTWAGNIEAQVQGPFVGGANLQVADLKLFVMMHSFISGVYDHIPQDCFKAFPKLTGLYHAVLEHPKVAEWRGRAQA